MMSGSNSSGTVICEEVFDENTYYSEEELKQYARRIGINPDVEHHLLPVARDGLMHPLPEEWKPIYDKTIGSYYYYNFRSRESRWENPMDDVYRSMVKKVRSESFSSAGEDDSKTSAREDLKSYEEAEISPDVLLKMADPLKLDTGGRGSLKKLAPLKKCLPCSETEHSSVVTPTSVSTSTKVVVSNSCNLDRRGKGTSSVNVINKDNKSSTKTDLTAQDKLLKSKKRKTVRQQEMHPSELDEQVSSKHDVGNEKYSPKIDNKETIPLPERREIQSPTAIIDIDKMDITSLTRQDSAKKGRLVLAREKHPRSMRSRSELTLKGGGAMFLKLEHQPELLSPNIEQDSDEAEDKAALETVASHSKEDSMPKSILRDQRPVTKQLWDVDPRNMSVEDKQLWRKQELEEERKSVRFNLEKDLDIRFNLSDSENVEEAANEFKADHQRDELWDSDEDDPDERNVGGVKVSDLLEHIDISEIDRRIIRESEEGVVVPDDVETQVERHKHEAVHYIKPGLNKGNILTIQELQFDENASLNAEPMLFNKSPSKNIKSHIFNAMLPQNRMFPGVKETHDAELKKVIPPNFNQENLHISDLETIQTEGKDENLLANIKENLKIQQEQQEKSIREKMESSLQKFRDALIASQELELQNMKEEHEKLIESKADEFQKQLAEEERKLEINFKQQLELFKKEFTAKGEYEKLKVLEQEQNILHTSLAVECEKQLAEEKLKLESETKKKLETLKKELLDIEENEIQKLQTKGIEDMKRIREEQEKKEALELGVLTSQLSNNLEKKRNELLEIHQQEIEIVEGKLKETLDAQKSIKVSELEVAQQKAAIIYANIKKQFDDEFENKKTELNKEHETILNTIKEDHVLILEKYRLDFKKEEDLAKKEHAECLDELKSKLSRELEAERQRIRASPDNQDDEKEREAARVFEKLRCEKRLLEDKYRSLKEKYIRLKSEVKLMERRKRRDGGTTTGSETERSTSHKAANISDTERQGSTKAPKNLQSELSPAADIQDKEKEELLTSPMQVDEDITTSSSKCQSKPTKFSEAPASHMNNRRRRQVYGRLRFVTTAPPQVIHNNNNNDTEPKEDEGAMSSPVENLRRQLEKLEDCEEHCTVSTNPDTRLRYPFTDTGQFGSSEYEIFRHRVHLERDLVRKAKDFLRIQRTNFQARQREWKQKQLDGSSAARNMLQQLLQEERELIDMEVSLHRTRLMGEKMLGLRHLEQCLGGAAATSTIDKGETRVLGAAAAVEDATLSDLSSHSASSGFSSTELVTETHLGRAPIHRHSHYEESTEIVKSLEILNTEIREIWEILNKQQKDNVMTALPPPQLVYTLSGWPGHTTALHTMTVAPTFSETFQALQQQAQNETSTGHYTPLSPNVAPYTQIKELQSSTNVPATRTPNVALTLVERTKSLRDWLRKAREGMTEL